jgi:hypothetical protein
MLFEDWNSTDPDDVREELKIELIVLNGALKDLNKNWDFMDIIRPLTTDQGPALAIIPKLKKQIERLTKLRDDFLLKELEEPRAAPATRSGGSARIGVTVKYTSTPRAARICTIAPDGATEPLHGDNVHCAEQEETRAAPAERSGGSKSVLRRNIRELARLSPWRSNYVRVLGQDR